MWINTKRLLVTLLIIYILLGGLIVTCDAIVNTMVLHGFNYTHENGVYKTWNYDTDDGSIVTIDHMCIGEIIRFWNK